MLRRHASWSIIGTALGWAMILTAVPASAAGIQAPRFAAARGYSVPVVPYTVAVADMTGDGRPDIVVASEANLVSVLRNRGRRSFAPAVNVSADGEPSLGSAGVSDLNADGFPDVVTAAYNDGTGSGSVSVLINNDGLGFLAPVVYPLTQAAEHVAIGDVDGDGIPDLAVTVFDFQTGTYSVGVMLNAGDGTFGSPVFYVEPMISGPSSLVDVNGDGANDFVVLDQIRSVLGVILGDGQGGFGSEATYQSGPHPASFALGDMNNDGSLDAVIGGAAGDGAFLRNRGDGTFDPAVPLSFGTNGSSAWVTVADLNGDGNLDIAVGSGLVTPEFGRGDGTFRHGGHFAAGGSPGGEAAGDLDGDGRQDLAVIGAYGTVTTLFGSLGNGFQAASTVIVSPGSLNVWTFAATDLSGDGLPDLAVGGGTGGSGPPRSRATTLGPSLLISLNQGGGRFGPPTTFQFSSDPFRIATGDFNADGVVDLAVSLATNDTDNIAIMLGTGGGAFGTPSLLSVSDFPEGVAAADFNGDGKLDIGLAIFNSGLQTSEAVVLPGNGDGTFGAAVKTTLANADPLGIVSADFNGDAVPDVGLIVHSDDLTDRVTAVTALGNGDGTFANEQQYGLGKGMGQLVTADLNADGIPDLVGSAPNSLRVVPLLGAGDGTFALQTAVRVGTRPHWLAVGDFTADGVPDLVIADEGGLLWPLPGLGDGTFGTGPPYASSTGLLAAADLDGNGTLDVAQSQTYNPIVSLFSGLVH